MSLSFHSTPLGRLQSQLDRPLKTSVRFQGNDEKKPDANTPEPEAPKETTISDVFVDISQFGSKVYDNTLGRAGRFLISFPNPFGSKANTPVETPVTPPEPTPSEAPPVSTPEANPETPPEATEAPPSGGWFSTVTDAASAIGQTVGGVVTNPVSTAKEIGTAVNDNVLSPAATRAQAGWDNSKDQLGTDLKNLPAALPTILLAAPVKPLLPLALGAHFKDTIGKMVQGIVDPKSVKPAQPPESPAPTDPAAPKTEDPEKK